MMGLATCGGGTIFLTSANFPESGTLANSLDSFVTGVHGPCKSYALSQRLFTSRKYCDFDFSKNNGHTVFTTNFKLVFAMSARTGSPSTLRRMAGELLTKINGGSFFRSTVFTDSGLGTYASTRSREMSTVSGTKDLSNVSKLSAVAGS